MSKVPNMVVILQNEYGTENFPLVYRHPHGTPQILDPFTPQEVLLDLESNESLLISIVVHLYSVHNKMAPSTFRHAYY